MCRPVLNTVVFKIDYRQTLALGKIIVQWQIQEQMLPEELVTITETDLWECQQKISHYRDFL